MWISSSQPLQEPASTWRMARLEEKRRPISARSCSPMRSTAGSRSRGRDSVTMPMRALLVRMPVTIFPCPLQILTGVRPVHRFIAHWKIGHDVVLYTVLQCRPGKPAWIAREEACDVPVGAEAQMREDLAAEALHRAQSLGALIRRL